MRRSLLTALYGYAAVAFALSLPLLAGLGHVSAGHGERVQADDGPMLALIRHELGRGNDPAELAALAAYTHMALRYLPWGDPAIPAGLRAAATLPGPFLPDGTPTNWVRLDRAGVPVGAVEVRPLNEAGRLGETFTELGVGDPRDPALGLHAVTRHPVGAGPGLAVEAGPSLGGLALAWAALVFLLTVPPAWFWVVRPLRRLAATARRLGAGDLDTPVGVGRRDELGALEGAFEGMRVELRRLIADQRQLIAQKERLLTDVSHEVRGPLARMLMALPLLRREGASGPMTDMFEQELEGAERMLSDLMRLARADAPAALAREAVDLADLARELAAARGKLGTPVAADLAAAPVSGDPRQLAIALRNLLDNAIAHAGHARLVSGVTGGQAWVRVEDDGPGIAPADLAAIFEPFYRPDASRSRDTGGAGLGLSIVRRIAEAHGGEATLESTPGVGTTATIRLPAA